MFEGPEKKFQIKEIAKVWPEIQTVFSVPHNKKDYNKEKVDEFTLALLYLVIHEREEGFGARAWKGFDWDTMNRLHEKGLITNPVGKAKSVGMTEQGFKRSENLFKKFF